jgi:hypothetical protein
MKYPIFKDNEWITPHYTKFKLICCDCSLVHDVQFRIYKDKIQFKLKRNNKSTGQARRTKK